MTFHPTDAQLTEAALYAALRDGEGDEDKGQGHFTREATDARRA